MKISKKIKNHYPLTNKEVKIIEIDPEVISENGIWSKKISVIEDSKGNQFRYAENESELYAFSDDSIPAYCYYDFDQINEKRYGKLYNYYAMKLLVKNTPKSWVFPNYSDYESISKISSYYGGFFTGIRWNEDLFYYHHADNFKDIDNYSLLWLNENPDTTGHFIQVISPNEIFPTILNCKSCCFSIRLVKNKTQSD